MLVELADGHARGDDLAVAQHGDAVGKAEHLVEHVADEQHAGAEPGDAADLAEQRVDLAAVERRGRLVEHEQTGLGRVPVLQRAHDRDRRPLGRRQRGDGLADVGGEAEREQQFLGACDLAPPADPPAEPVS